MPTVTNAHAFPFFFPSCSTNKLSGKASTSDFELHSMQNTPTTSLLVPPTVQRRRELEVGRSMRPLSPPTLRRPRRHRPRLRLPLPLFFKYLLDQLPICSRRKTRRTSSRKHDRPNLQDPRSRFPGSYLGTIGSVLLRPQQPSTFRGLAYLSTGLPSCPEYQHSSSSPQAPTHTPQSALHITVVPSTTPEVGAPSAGTEMRNTI
jgi:hypothetical protein